MQRAPVIAVLLAAVGAAGCSHPLRIANLHEYRLPPAPPLEPKRTLGVVDATGADPAGRDWAEAVAEGLRRDPSFSAVPHPWDGLAPVDVVVELAIRPTYRGRLTNFLIAFPGFFVFAPAVWGYGYEAEIEARAALRAADGATAQVAIPVEYRFRHAGLDRTWIEAGWLVLPVGMLAPMAGGAVFVTYDPDLTPELVGRAAPNYGTYVARRIREAIGRLGQAPPPGDAGGAARPGG